MTKAERFLKKLESDRPKILNDDARKHAAELVKDKAKAKAFLQRAGILDKNGNFTRPYCQEV